MWSALGVFHRRAGHIWPAALFPFFLGDDALEVHDKLARSSGTRIDIDLPSSLSLRNRGEPLVCLPVLAIAVSMLLGARRSMEGAHRGVWSAFALAVFALTVVGAGVDMVHGVLDAVTGDGTPADFVDTMFVALEDGGEGIVDSATVRLALDGMLNAVRAGGTARMRPLMVSSPA